MKSLSSSRLSTIGLSGNQLKIIAMIAMLIDHVVVQFFPQFPLWRIPGRIAFPVFAFMIAEGCRYTRNRARYLLQLAGLGIACQLVFTVAMHSLYLGILITFSLAIVTIYTIDDLLRSRRVYVRLLLCTVLAGVLFVVIVCPVLFRAQGFMLDYGICGILLPVSVYYARGKGQKLLAMTGVLTLYALLYDPIKWFAMLSVPLLALYNGTRGKYNLKYLFYIFYPTHLAVIYLIFFLVYALT